MLCAALHSGPGAAGALDYEEEWYDYEAYLYTFLL